MALILLNPGGLRSPRPIIIEMASGLPVVASDLPVHHEICGAAAVYFDRFSAEGASEQILRVAQSSELSRDMARQGGLRSKDFSWRHHIDQIVSIARNLNSCGVTVVRSR